MKKVLVFSCIGLLFLICNITLAQDQPARDLIASIAELPGLAETPDKGPYVELIQAIDNIYPGKIKIEINPFPRSIDKVVNGQADFHLPKLKNPLIPESKLPYQFVSEPYGTVAFVIYSNQDKIITRKNLDEAVAKGGQFPYKFDMVPGSESNFPFPGVPHTDFDESLKKIQNKRIDGLIWSQEESDLVVKALKLNAIHRELYGDYDEVMLIQKGSRSDELNKILSDCLRKLVSSGQLKKLYNKIHAPYNDWQPSNMGW